jgi:acetylornithine/succinyldiaminopimelate/putrescine aminotransferase
MLFHELLSGMHACKLRSAGLLMALEFKNFETNKAVIDHCLANGLLTDWFLFAPNCMRIAPPLNMSKQQIKKACAIIREAVLSIE